VTKSPHEFTKNVKQTGHVVIRKDDRLVGYITDVQASQSAKTCAVVELPEVGGLHHRDKRRAA
jgi:hypothetical protein